MTKLRTAVIGVGYLGKFHAEKFKLFPHSELIAICDVDIEKTSEIAQKLHTEMLTDYRPLIGRVDAVSIATPTALHYEIALFFLSHGVHVLVEKPMTQTIAQAEELIQAAKKNEVILQVGHLERFNKVVKAAEPFINNPKFIESVRIAPFKLRGTDVNVVMDLMIHDIDIIQSIVKSGIRHIAANGSSVLSSCMDIANARIEFHNGCVANLTASRISSKLERKIRVFQQEDYLCMDLNKKELTIHRKKNDGMIPEMTCESLLFEQTDALKDQIEDFLNCILNNKKPLVSGEEGKSALATAIQISEIAMQGA